MKPWFKNFKPISMEGKLVYIAALILLVLDFKSIASVSDSVSGTLINFFPHAGLMFLILALIIKARSEKDVQSE
ncbi:MAG TPA: hypothetical protein VEC17_00360 [Candidatus Binatia bacterium]|nr:hypothetical protein [Candidatus Binatia bacterium]